MKNLSPLVALIAGLLLFFVSMEQIKFVLAIYLIITGILGLTSKR